MKLFYLTLTLYLFGYTTAYAQQCSMRGTITDKTAKPLAYATVSLLQPGDSTLAFFGITDEQGMFSIKSITKGAYVLQVATMGFATIYKAITVSSALEDAGTIVLKEEEHSLNEVQVKADRIPLMIKGDTIEYNAGAFKVKQDAAVEDLLKKLPGVQVDKAGNIKAQGKDVQKVLVDGKEFFGNDPKVATRNLPADAIDKVQVFNKHSDQSQFTGIDDGEREETINLLLKNNKKGGYFGDVQAGYGSGEHYQAGAKLYKFKPKTQVAALGMWNNINQFGFTLQDYINFRGGMRGLMDGSGNVELRLNQNLPVNFGQPVTGLISSGAGGLNYNYEPRKNNRFNISYLGNGMAKELSERTTTTNYTPEGSFVRKDGPNEKSSNEGHRLNYSWRNDIDSFNQVVLNGTAEYTSSATSRNNFSSSYIRDIVLNNFTGITTDKGDDINIGLRASYLKKLKSNWPVFKIFAEASYGKNFTSTKWNNATTFYDTTPRVIYDRQYQDNVNEKTTSSAGTSFTRKLGGGYYLEPELRAGTDLEYLQRGQGDIATPENNIDTLSPRFQRNYSWIRPGLAFKKSTKKIQFNTAVRVESGSLYRQLNNMQSSTNTFLYILPSAFWQKETKSGTQLSFTYNSEVGAPSAIQMMPVPNSLNRLYITRGNNSLQPEYVHRLNAGWVHFDQFSFTSLFANISARYINNKINWARTVNTDLSQSATFVNVPDDYNITGRVEYTTPIKKFRINLSLSLEEQYNKGMNIINSIYNTNNTFIHELRLSGSNKKKEKWDIEAGVGLSVSDAYYSVDQSFNNTFYNYNAFAQLSYKPNDRWFLGLNADVNRYDARSFNEAITIPLLKGTISYYCLQGRRGVITFEAFDILNENKSLERNSQLNYLIEKRANIIGQYFMLTFKYRINKTGSSSGPGGIKVDVKR